MSETRMSEQLSGAEFKKQLRDGTPKMGLFLNSHSPTVAEQLAHSGYDWLLVDTQHGPMGYEKPVGDARRHRQRRRQVDGARRPAITIARGIQQALDMGADGVLVPYINTADEARQAVSCCRYPTAGTRSVYFPQRSMNKAGLLGYAGAANDNVDRRAAGGDRRLHQEHRRDRRRPRRRHPVPRPERPVHVDGPVREVQVPAHVHVARAAATRPTS